MWYLIPAGKFTFSGLLADPTGGSVRPVAGLLVYHGVLLKDTSVDTAYANRHGCGWICVWWLKDVDFFAATFLLLRGCSSCVGVFVSTGVWANFSRSGIALHCCCKSWAANRNLQSKKKRTSSNFMWFIFGNFSPKWKSGSKCVRSLVLATC